MLHKSLFIVAVLLLIISLQGCARYEPHDAGTVLEIKDESSAIVEQQDVKVSITEASEDEEITEYRVGPGDVLVINVPGLIDTYGSSEKTQNFQGFRVQKNAFCFRNGFLPQHLIKPLKLQGGFLGLRVVFCFFLPQKPQSV